MSGSEFIKLQCSAADPAMRTVPLTPRNRIGSAVTILSASSEIDEISQAAAATLASTPHQRSQALNPGHFSAAQTSTNHSCEGKLYYDGPRQAALALSVLLAATGLYRTSLIGAPDGLSFEHFVYIHTRSTRTDEI